MAPIDFTYQKQMLQLQEELRTWREEELQMEQQFRRLLQESRGRQDECAKRLRKRFTEYVQELQVRDEKNRKLLAAMDKVTERLILINAKRDNLHALKEADYFRLYNLRLPRDDSGIDSENKKKYWRKSTAPIHPALILKNTNNHSSSRVHSASPQLDQARSIPASKFHGHINVNNTSNDPTLPPTPPNASAETNHQQTNNIPCVPHIYLTPVAQPGDHLLHLPTIPISDIYQAWVPNPTIGNVALTPQKDPNLCVAYTPTAVLPMAPSNAQHNIFSANQLLVQHIRQTPPSFLTSTIFARNAGPSHGNKLPETDSSNITQPPKCENPNILSRHSQSPIKDHNPLDTPTASPTSSAESNQICRTGHVDCICKHISKLTNQADTEIDDLLKINEDLLLQTNYITKYFNLNDKKIVESELDKYINNIRLLQQKYNIQDSQDLDYEQNTSGDLLNVTLSEDALNLPAEDKMKKEEVPEKMEKTLTLASDFASETGNPEIVQLIKKNEYNNLHIKVQLANRIKSQVIEDRIEKPKVLPGTYDEHGTQAFAKEIMIKEDITPFSTEIENSCGNVEFAEQNSNNTDLRKSQKCDQETINITKDDIEEKKLQTDDMSNKQNGSNEKKFKFLSEKSKLDHFVDAMGLRSLNIMQKKIQELQLDTPDIEMKESEFHNKNETLPDRIEIIENKPAASICEENKNAKKEQYQEHNINEADNMPQTKANINEHENIIHEEQKEFDKTSKLQIDDKLGGPEENNEYTVKQEDVEDSNQAQIYAQDPNEQYNYDQNMPYEVANNKGYERYGDQGYAEEGQEYIEYVDNQYIQDPNDQQVPNAQYEQNLNQEYDYNYDPQYDPNQEYQNVPNQAYDYNETTAYDPNQTYDNAFEQEYKEEEHKPNNDAINAECCEEIIETKEISQHQIDQESEHKSNNDKPEQIEDSVNDTNQPEKKDVIKSLLDSDTDTTIEKNISNTESDFDFN